MSYERIDLTFENVGTTWSQMIIQKPRKYLILRARVEVISETVAGSVTGIAAAIDEVTDPTQSSDTVLMYGDDTNYYVDPWTNTAVTIIDRDEGLLFVGRTKNDRKNPNLAPTSVRVRANATCSIRVKIDIQVQRG